MSSKFKELVRWATLNPNGFCEKILNSPNDIWQAEILDAVADLDRARLGLPTKFNHELKNRFSIVAFHGCGKTHFVAKLMHWFNFTRRGKIPCTAPKEKQLTTRTWPEFRKVLGGADEAYQQIIKCDRKHIAWFGDHDWCAIVETASQPENLAGYHDDHIMFMCEESSGIDENMFPVIEGALTTPMAILVLIGNPTKNSGEFYNSHNKPGTKELYYQKQIKLHETTRVSQKWVDGMIRKYGRNSPVVKVRVLGEFADSAPNQLIVLPWLEEAIGREMDDGSHPRLRVTCDVAAGGVDDTIIIVSKIYFSYVRVIKLLRFSFPQQTAVSDTRKACAQIFDAYEGKADNNDDIVIDAVGVGDGAGAELINQGYNVIRYKGGERSDDTDMWRNRRVQSYMCLRNALQNNEITFEPDFIDETDLDDFYAQLTSVMTKNDTEKLEDLETKKEMLARGAKSPDMGDGTSMIYATQTPYLQTNNVIETIGELESAMNESW